MIIGMLILCKYNSKIENEMFNNIASRKKLFLRKKGMCGK